MKTLIAMAALALSALACNKPAHADTVTITWDNPLTNTDNTVIPDTGPGSLQSWRFEYGTCIGQAPNETFGVKAGEITRTRAVGGPSLITTTNNFNPGTTCLRGYVTNTYGNESPVSNVKSKTVIPPTPGPIRLTALGDAAFIPVKMSYGWAMGDQVGTVRPGAECDPDQPFGNGCFALKNPTHDVYYYIGRKPRALVAAHCS